MKKMLMLVFVGLMFGPLAYADLKCAVDTEMIWSCTGPKGEMIDEAVICKNSEGEFELTVAGDDDAAPTLLAKAEAREGATVYSAEEEGVSLRLSIGGRPLKNESGVVYRKGSVRLILDDMAFGATLECVRYD